MDQQSEPSPFTESVDGTYSHQADLDVAAYQAGQLHQAVVTRTSVQNFMLVDAIRRGERNDAFMQALVNRKSLEES